MAPRRRGPQPEDVPRAGRPLQAAGPVGVPALQHPLRPGHQGHVHLCDELRRVPSGRADVSVAGQLILNTACVHCMFQDRVL